MNKQPTDNEYLNEAEPREVGLDALVMWLTSPVSTSFGMAGRLKKGEDLSYYKNIQNPRFGFYWWEWLPFFHSNGGRVHYGEVYDCSISWLCFYCGITFWGSST